MSLIDRLLGRDLTRNWTKRNTDLTFDLDRLTINGVKPGDRFDVLDWLGPADERQRDSDQYRWYSLGLAVVPARDRISQIYLIWRGFTGFGVWADEVGIDYQPFGNTWTCLHEGKPVVFDQAVGWDALANLFGVDGELAGEGPKTNVDNYISGAEYDGKDFGYSFEDEARYYFNVTASFDAQNQLCLIRLA